MTPIIQDFVQHFGEMGSRWGINRTVGQVYALLFVSERPLDAEDLVAELGISRSNVSMAIKELRNWRLLETVYVPDARSEHFTAPEDVWRIFQTLAEERRRREVDPTLSMLRGVLLREPENSVDKHALSRMGEMHDLIELAPPWHHRPRPTPSRRGRVAVHERA
ncbi:MAG: GbsR/MarR family transcriptional regulator, partial [Pseudomonadota bacterium]